MQTSPGPDETCPEGGRPAVRCGLVVVTVGQRWAPVGPLDLSGKHSKPLCILLIQDSERIVHIIFSFFNLTCGSNSQSDLNHSSNLT